MWGGFSSLADLKVRWELPLMRLSPRSHNLQRSRCKVVLLEHREACPCRPWRRSKKVKFKTKCFANHLIS